MARATVNDEGGKDIFIMSDLPDWVLNWKDLEAEERSSMDIDSFLRGTAVMNSMCFARIWGLVDGLARELVEEEPTRMAAALQHPAISVQGKFRR